MKGLLRRPWVPHALAAVATALVVEVGLFAVSFARPPLTFDVGPSTGSYGAGFTESWEYHPVSARFASERATVELPLTGTGEAVVSVRYSRLWRSPLTSRLLVNDATAVSFTASPARLTLEGWSPEQGVDPFQDFDTVRGTVRLTDEPLRLVLVNDEARGSPYKLAIDWIRLEGARWRIPMRAFHVRLLVVGVLLVLCAAGFGLAASLGLTGAVGAMILALAAVDPFGLAHVTSRITYPAVVFTLAAAGILRRWGAGGRFIVLAFLLGYLAKGFGVFYPSYFYGDVRSHRRYALAFANASGGLYARGVEAQRRAGIGYPLHVVGTDYAFPYSPLFYMPFTDFRQEALDESMKHVALAAASAEVLIVAAVARVAFGARAAVLGAFLAAFLPPLHSRLLLAMWPAIVGHFFDSLAVVAASMVVIRDRWSLLAIAATTVAFTSYVTGPIIVGVFLVCLCLLEYQKRRAVRVLLAALAVGSGAVAILYLPFWQTFFGDVLPSFLASDGVANTRAQTWSLAFSRVPLFYGYVYPALALGGLYLAWKRESVALAPLLAYGATFLVLVALRVLGGGMLYSMKEILFLGPWLAVTAAGGLAAFSERSRGAKIAAAVVTVGCVAFGMVRYAGYLEPVTALAALP